MTPDQLDLDGFIAGVEQRRELSTSLESLIGNTNLSPGDLALLKDTLDKDAAVAAGSFCEVFVCSVMTNVVSHIEPGIQHFIMRQAVDRKFFQWFDFNSANANTFFRLFGPELSAVLKGRAQDADLSASIRAFLQLCKARNELVHNNYVAVDTTNTVSDTYAHVRSASRFLTWLATDFADALQTSEALSPTGQTDPQVGMSSRIGPTVLGCFGPSCWWFGAAGFEAVGVGSGFDDVGVEGESVDDCGDEPGVGDNLAPFAKWQV